MTTGRAITLILLAALGLEAADLWAWSKLFGG
jgi:hypothetical protein